MKIKRFEARSMREAIRLVREEQGPDAVILSNRRTSNGVEVVAAVDYDAALMQQTMRHVEATRTPVAAEEPETVSAPTPALPRAAHRGGSLSPSPARSAGEGRDGGAVEDDRKTIAAKAAAIRKRAALAAKKRSEARTVAPPYPAPPAPPAAPAPVVPRLIAPTLAPQPAAQVQALAPRISPQQLLTGFGLDRKLIDEICAQLPANLPADRTRMLPLAMLARRIAVPESETLLKGGVYALVGPTGAGKTTTLAKLAARFIAESGSRDVAIVSTDHYRIGAQEQLFTYGRLLGLPVHSAASANDLARTLKELKGKKLVLIDTAGLGARDNKLAAQLAELAGAGTAIKPLLVLAANCQAHDLDLVARRFHGIAPAGCVLTKLDETTRLGGALSVVIHHQLPVWYTADGQRVPEDLAPARADRLVLGAVQLARPAPAAVPAHPSISATGAAHAAL